MNDIQPGSQVRLNNPDTPEYHGRIARVVAAKARFTHSTGWLIVFNDDNSRLTAAAEQLQFVDAVQAGDRVRIDWPFDNADRRTGHIIETRLQRLAEPACRVRCDDPRSRIAGTPNEVLVPCRNIVILERADVRGDTTGEQT